MTPFLLLLIAALLVGFGGLMSAVDAALAVTSRQDLAELGDSGRNAGAIRRIAADPDAHANAVAFMRVFAETGAAALVTAAFTVLFSSIWWALLVTIVIMTGISFVGVGASPSAAARRNARGLLRGAAPVVRGVRILLGPVAHGLVLISSRATSGGARAASFDTEEQLLSMLDEAAMQALIEEDDRELIHSVFEFTDTYVRQVMVPRTEVVAAPADATVRDALTLFLDRGVSRMPVLSADGEDVDGILYLKDLVQLAFRDEQRTWGEQSAAGVARAPIFVPESMRAETLLQQMKRDAVHVCMVVDEYGGVSGLVTLEDLIEELVGEISDEYDPRTADVVEVGPGRFRVSASLGLDEVGDLFDLSLDDDDVDSIGGLLGKLLGRVPQSGDVVGHEGLEITGGASRGRGRGLATVFVARADEKDGDVDG